MAPLLIFLTSSESSLPSTARVSARLRGVLEEILVSEVLTRVWTAVLCAHDACRGAEEAGPAARSVLLGHIEARHRAPAGSGRQQPAEHPDDGGFAGAIGPQEAENFSRAHLEGNVVHGHEVAKGLDQVVDFEGGGHVRFFPVGQTIVFCGLPCSFIAGTFRIGSRIAALSL